MKGYIEGNRILLHCEKADVLRVKQDILSRLRPQDLLHKDLHVLSLPISAIKALADIVDKYKIELSDGLRTAIAAANELEYRHHEARKCVLAFQEEGFCATSSDYWDSVLQPHQGVAVNCMIVKDLPGICIFDEQGMGKTLEAIAAADLLLSRGEIESVFIVCPKTLVGGWKREIDKFVPAKYTLEVIEGSLQQKYDAVLKGKQFLVLNYESVKPLQTLLTSICSTASVLLIVDESYNVKNEKAIRSAVLVELRKHCKKAFVLCGTPAPNKPTDIVNQFNIADGGITFGDFHAKSASESDKDHILELIDKRGIFLRRTKEETLPDLPKKSFHITDVTMSPLQAALYERAKQDLILYLRQLDNTSFRRNLTTYFQRRAVLLQICVSPKLVDPAYNEVAGKHLVLDSIVKNRVEKLGKKMIIWTVYTRSLDELEVRYSKHNPVRIDGTITSSAARAALVEAFQKDPSRKLFIGNPAAGGAGLTLTAASDCVYFSYSNQAAHYLQSIDRIHRIGQTAKKVTYTFLRCAGTIEESELSRLSDKETQQRNLLGDAADEKQTLEAALRELGVKD